MGDFGLGQRGLDLGNRDHAIAVFIEDGELIADPSDFDLVQLRGDDCQEDFLELLVGLPVLHSAVVNFKRLLGELLLLHPGVHEYLLRGESELRLGDHVRDQVFDVVGYTDPFFA